MYLCICAVCMYVYIFSMHACMCVRMYICMHASFIIYASLTDMETWMYPVLTVLYPDLARVASQYRLDRLNASLANARIMGFDGAMWSWESAFTGLFASMSRGNDFHENHISADIPLAMRKFFYATGDKQWLASSWPLLNATCIFWACRFRRIDSVASNPPAGYGPNCRYILIN